MLNKGSPAGQKQLAQATGAGSGRCGRTRAVGEHKKQGQSNERRGVTGVLVVDRTHPSKVAQPASRTLRVASRTQQAPWPRWNGPCAWQPSCMALDRSGPES